MGRVPHSLGPYLSVRNADVLLRSYERVLGGVLTKREPSSGPVARAEMRLGDSVITLTEELPQGNYVLFFTNDINSLETKICEPGSGWSVISRPQRHDSFLVMHATDPAGVTWIVQQPVSGQKAES